MFLQALITENLANRDINEVASQLGYKTPEKVSARIKAITASPCLALDKSSFDFRYITPELVKKLCEILNIPEGLYNKIIKETEVNILQQQQKFKPYIYVETYFQRKNEPISALALMENTRYVPIESPLHNLPLNDLLDHVKEIVKSHYQKQASLPLWGEIKQYAFFCDEHTVIVLSSQGQVTDALPSYIRSKAILKF